jgi:hypothetical protein
VKLWRHTIAGGLLMAAPVAARAGCHLQAEAIAARGARRRRCIYTKCIDVMRSVSVGLIHGEGNQGGSSTREAETSRWRRVRWPGEELG